MDLKPYLIFYKKEKKLKQYQILKFTACAMIIIFATQYLLIDPMAIKLGIGGMDKGFSNSDSITIISALIFAPFIEELIFRGYLSGKYLQYWFFFIIPVLGMLLFMSYWWILLTIGIVFLFWFLYENSKKEDQKYIPTVLFYSTFIFTTIFFAILHIGNVESDSMVTKVFFTIVSLTPGALLFGWIRYQGGLHYSIILHSLFNLITISLNELLYA